MKIKVTSTVRSTDLQIEEVAAQPNWKRQSFTNVFTGEMEGSSKFFFDLVQPTETSGHYVGYELYTGKIHDKEGSFLIQHVGHFTPERGAIDIWKVVPGTGIADFENLRGEGTFSPTQEENMPLEMEFELA